jgi:hypothetical protein
VFLRELATDGNRRRAAEAARVDHATVYRWRNTDADFRAQWDAAIDQAGEHLEAEAWRRAAEGVDKPLVSMGKVVRGDDGEPLMVREYSDSLMALLLRGARPQKYRDNLSITSASTSLGISVVLESMRNDRSIAEAAAEFVGLLDATSEAEG